ncbi:MBL fold metallo-hydrolase [Methanothrix soehngenii]|jgi:glyoxylase-like metal-dependent hydrolase (beta-lactamase superfamily II)|nr:MBL fold metallo-hydrolase [Methanothrix soehngenii]MDY0411869.1 MBL fold metallo-hydrolase [Methanothrix soehngenii]
MRPDEMLPRVFLLKSGSIERDQAGNILDARSSVTLIKTERGWIIVDTGQVGDEEEILKALVDLGLEKSDIDIIVNTHSHPDHCANNRLFSQAKTIYPKDGELIAPGVRALVTPGHSPDSISVVVDATIQQGDEMAPTSRRVVIAGDALPTLGNFQKRVPPAVHYDRALAVASMNKIIEMADIVIPGHDRPFSLQEESPERFVGLMTASSR